jgi:hypothetical protein
MVENCANCAFWKRIPYGSTECRRHAPIKASAPWKDDIGDDIWPVTMPHDFCGDFELKDAS